MPELITPIAEWAGAIIEALGIGIIMVVAIYALMVLIIALIKRDHIKQAFQRARGSLGQGILLGLEFLVAADIIHTVAVELTWDTVGVLAVVVLIRTFLSFTIDLELTGRWPWQDGRKSEDDLSP